MHYFTRAGTQTATAETDERAVYLIAHGWRECSADEHRHAWMIRNWIRRDELVQEDRTAVQRMSYAQRVKLGV